jgi:hypothetical protein
METPLVRLAFRQEGSGAKAATWAAEKIGSKQIKPSAVLGKHVALDDSTGHLRWPFSRRCELASSSALSTAPGAISGFG